MTEVITAQDRAREKLRAKALDQPRDDKGRFVPTPQGDVLERYRKVLGYDENLEPFPKWKQLPHPADMISTEPQEPTLIDPGADDVPEGDPAWMWVWLLVAFIIADGLLGWFWTPIMRWL